MRSKSFFFTCAFSFLFIISWAQNSLGGFNLNEVENYQSRFFSPFTYSDFSYRFGNSSFINPSFRRKIGEPTLSTLSIAKVSYLDTLKAKSNIYFVLGSQKNQLLQVENLQRVGKTAFIYLNYSSLATLGYLKNSSSKNRCFAFDFNFSKRFYQLNAKLKIISNNDACFGGIKDSTISSFYSKRDLQQLDVFLSADYLKKKYFNFNLNHSFNLWHSNDSTKGFYFIFNSDFSKASNCYTGEGVNQFYQYTFIDSSKTNDTIGFFWYKNVANLCLITKHLNISSSIEQNNFEFRQQDSLYLFNDYVTNSKVEYKNQQFLVMLSASKNISNNLRKNNFVFASSVMWNVNAKVIKQMSYNLSYNALNVPFEFQKYYSNHFSWYNSFNTPVKSFSQNVAIRIGSNFNVSASYSRMEDRVFLNEHIQPEISKDKESVFSYALCFDDTIGKFHLANILQINSSNSKNLAVIPLQDYLRIGCFLSLFKNNLKMETGFSVSYNDAWYASNYCPALDEFYLQSNRKYDGLPILSLFADFKIKAATLFLKIERINIGWSNENSFVREGYVAPPRTLRFGLNWPLIN